MTVAGVAVVNIGSAQAVNRIQATSISVGGETSLGYGCALLVSGQVLCWGDGAPITGIVPGINTAVNIAAGKRHTCAALQNGNVKCWGSNDSGELGDGSTVLSAIPVTVKGVAGVGLLSDIVEISSSAKNAVTCARSSAGQVACWGSQTNLILGDARVTTFSSTPVIVRDLATSAPLTNIATIALGTYAACAVKTNGSTFCWGFGGHLELGNPVYASSREAIPVVGIGGTGFLTDATQISLGDAMGCVRRSTGAVACWGMNNLGSGTGVGSAFPVDVLGISNAVEVSTDQENACVILTTHAVKCWGSWHGTEGANPNEKYPTTNDTPSDFGSFTDAKTLSTGGGWPQKYCAVLLDSSVRCWGSNQFGELGVSKTSLMYGGTPVEPQLSFVMETTTSTSTSTSSTTSTIASIATTVAPTSSTTVSSATTMASSLVTSTTVSQGQLSIATIAPGRKTSPIFVGTSTLPPESTTTTVISAPNTTIPPVAADVASGEGSFVRDGVSTKPSITREANRLLVTAGAYNASMSGETSSGKPIPLDADGNVHLKSGDYLRVNVDGFSPGDTCDVWMFSTPVKLGRVTVGSDGRISEKFAIPKNVEKGDHRVVVSVGSSPTDSAVFTVGFKVGTVNGSSTLTRALIGIPLLLAIAVALLLPNQLRRRKLRPSVG